MHTQKRKLSEFEIALLSYGDRIKKSPCLSFLHRHLSKIVKGSDNLKTCLEEIAKSDAEASLYPDYSEGKVLIVSVFKENLRSVMRDLLAHAFKGIFSSILFIIEEEYKFLRKVIKSYYIPIVKESYGIRDLWSIGKEEGKLILEKL